MTARVRFAPSPTGELHLGNARTALMNWLWVRQQIGGRFILRIEDTDRERSRESHTRDILESLTWLGLDWDEGPDRGGPHGPYVQSASLSLHAVALERLRAAGHVYLCTCSEAELERQREGQVSSGLPPRYDGRCRNRPPAVDPLPHGAWRFRVPAGRELVLEDLVRGTVRFRTDDLGDFVVARHDGTPTYHLAVVVDDARMEISHVIRGEDHLANTPRHLLLHEALGSTAPAHAHLPMILAPDRTKLSKRHGATSIRDLREQGYLPEAVLNHLALLGWSPPDGEELRTRESLIRDFSLERVHHAGAIHDLARLTWLNASWLRRLDAADLRDRARSWLGAPFTVIPEERLLLAIALVQDELETLRDLPDHLSWLLAGPDPASLDLPGHGLEPESVRRVCTRLAADLPDLPEAPDDLKNHFKTVSRDLGLGMKAVLLPTRLALTGRAHGPELARLVASLGRVEAIARLERVARA
jgi:glutamyl-tRNA synthetase